MPDDVQPGEGQGSEASGGLFDSYLQTVPQDARDTVASYLQDASKKVEDRLEEAATIQKSLGAYRDVDLSAYPPEQLSELLAWHQQVTSTPEAFQQWLANTAKEAGLTLQEERELQAAEEEGELSKDEVQKLIEERAAQQLAPIEQRMAEWEEQRGIDVESESIGKELARLEKESALDLSEDQRAMVLDLGIPLSVNEKGEELPLGDVSWVAKGLERFKEIHTQGQRLFVEQKATQPKSPMSAGGQEAFKPTTDWKEATEQAKERLRQALT